MSYKRLQKASVLRNHHTCGAANDTWVGVSRHPRKTSPPQGNVSKAGGAPTTPTAQEKDAIGTIRVLSEVSFPGGDLDGARGTGRSAFRGGRTAARHEYDTRGLSFVKT